MKELKKLVVVGDSLAVPRPEDQIPFQATYPGMLAACLHEHYYLINRARRANTVVKQVAPLNLMDDIIAFEPAVVIIQLGIVDCAPRVFSARQQKMINRLPAFLRNPIVSTASRKRRWLTEHFPKVYVEKSHFEPAYRRLVSECKKFAQQVICIGIAPTSQRNRERSFNYDANIQEYNAIIEAICSTEGVDFVPAYTILSGDRHLLKDGIHLNEAGAKLIFDSLLNLLSSEKRPATSVANTI